MTTDLEPAPRFDALPLLTSLQYSEPSPQMNKDAADTIRYLLRENEAMRKQCDEWRADYNRRLGCPEEIVREFSSRATAHFDIFKDKP